MSFHFSKTIRLTGLSYINQVISMALLLVQVKVLTHFLSLSAFGAWSQIGVAVILINMILSLNLGHGFVRFSSSYSIADKHLYFYSVLIFQTALHLLMIFVLWPFRYSIIVFLSDSNYKSLYWAIAVMSVFSIMIVNIQNLLLVTGNEIQMIRQNLIRQLSDVFFTISGAWIQKDIVGAAWGYALSGVFCFILFSLINRISYLKMQFSFSVIKGLLVFSVPLMSISIAYWVMSSSNRYLVKYYMGLEAVGLFSVANRLPMMLVIIFTLLSTIFLSNISRLFDSGNFERVNYWFTIIIKTFLYFGIAGGTFLIAANRSLTLVISNENYLFNNIPIVYLTMAIGSLAFGVFQILSRLYDLEKKVLQNSLNWIFAMILNVILNILFIPPFGILGASIATALSFVFSLIIALFFRPRSIELTIPWRNISIYLLISFFAAYCYAIFNQISLHSIVIGFVVSSAISIGSLLLGLSLKVISLNELAGIVKKD